MGNIMTMKSLKYIKGCNFHPYKTIRIKALNSSKVLTFFMKWWNKSMQDHECEPWGKLSSYGHESTLEIKHQKKRKEKGVTFTQMKKKTMGKSYLFPAHNQCKQCIRPSNLIENEVPTGKNLGAFSAGIDCTHTSDFFRPCTCCSLIFHSGCCS